MRKKEHAKVVLARLQAHRSGIVDVFLGQQFPELFKASARKGRQRLGHLGKVAEGHKTSAAICQLTDVFTSTAGVKVGRESRRKT